MFFPFSQYQRALRPHISILHFSSIHYNFGFCAPQDFFMNLQIINFFILQI